MELGLFLMLDLGHNLPGKLCVYLKLILDVGLSVCTVRLST